MTSRAASLALLAALAACSSTPHEPLGPLAKENLFVVNAAYRLIGLNAGQPQRRQRSHDFGFQCSRWGNAGQPQLSSCAAACV